jgi:hypothetical protein
MLELNPDPNRGRYSNTLAGYAGELSKAVYDNHATWETWASKIGSNLLRELTENYGLTDAEAETQITQLRRVLREADRAMIDAGRTIQTVGAQVQVFTDCVNRALKRAERPPVGGVPLWRAL